MTAAIEKRLQAAREARNERAADRAAATTGDAILDALDGLPDASSQVEQVKFWAAQRLSDNDMLGYMRKEAALYWVNGPQKR